MERGEATAKGVVAMTAGPRSVFISGDTANAGRYET
jgi:hypothetical protein